MAELAPAVIDRERMSLKHRGSFARFARAAMPLLPRMPAKPAWTWVQDELCNHYEAMWRGELPMNTLLLALAPGGGKSSIVSDLGPAWIYSHTPEALLMGASYDDALQLRSCSNMLTVMSSRWYIERWGDLTNGADPKRPPVEFYTSRGGYRFSTSVLGKGTGRHCDLYTVDDPLKAITARRNEDKDAQAARELAIATEFMQSSVVSRGRDENFRLCVNHQRLHEGDPIGFVQRAIPEATTLRLPFKFEPHARCVTVVGGDRRTRADEILDPRLARKVELEVRLAGGWTMPVIQAQYQQHPTPPGGRIFHESTFNRFDPRAEGWRIQDTIAAISLDCAFKGGSESDYVAIEVWGYASGKFLCFYSWIGRITFTETLAQLVHVHRAFPSVMTILIEDAANGPAIVDTLTQKSIKYGCNVATCKPVSGKVGRARAASAHFGAGNAYFSLGMPTEGEHDSWPRKRDAMLKFPIGNDDDTDAMTQMILWLAAEYGGAENLDEAVDGWESEKGLIEGARAVDLYQMLYSHLDHGRAI